MISRKSIAIIGEGYTEWFYFESLRIKERYRFEIKPSFPKHSDLGHMLQQVKKCVNEQYDYVVCLLDMDVLFEKKAEMTRYQQAKSSKEYEGVLFLETNPCTEFWFLLHFLPTFSTKSYHSYQELLPDLKKYLPDYQKSERYFKKKKLYDYLMEYGSLDNAIEYSERLCSLAQNNPEDFHSYSEIYKLIQLLKELNTNQ